MYSNYVVVPKWCGVVVASLFMLVAGVANSQSDPAVLYATHCASCHGAAGLSVIPQTPDLTRSNLIIQADQDIVTLLRDGRNEMPSYFGVLNDQELIDLVNYLRTFP